MQEQIEPEAIILTDEQDDNFGTSAPTQPATQAPDPAGVSSASAHSETPAPHIGTSEPEQAVNETPAVTADSSQDAQIAHLIGRSVADVERELILNTLDHCIGNRTQAAKILGISIRTLRNKLNQYKDEGLEVSNG